MCVLYNCLLKQFSACQVDICFAIDRNITAENWTLELDFTSQLSGLMNIEDTRTKVGLVSYNDASTLDIKLNDHNVTSSLQTDILGQPHDMGTGRAIDSALLRLRSDCFNPGTGKYIILASWYEYIFYQVV